MFITESDRTVKNNNKDILKKLKDIKNYTSACLQDISDDELNAFDGIYKKSMEFKAKMQANLTAMIKAKAKGDEAKIKEITAEGGSFLNALEDYGVDFELVADMWDYENQIEKEANPMAKERMQALHDILAEQWVLKVLLRVRTIIEPRLVTDYSDYL